MGKRTRKYLKKDWKGLLTQPSTQIQSFTAYGVDGCRAGWFFVALKPYGEIHSGIVETIEKLINAEVVLTVSSSTFRLDCPIEVMRGSVTWALAESWARLEQAAFFEYPFEQRSKLTLTRSLSA